MNQSWNDKYWEMYRWLQRIESQASKPQNTLDDDYVADSYNAYFLSCWSLKDWLKNDQAVSITSKHIEAEADKEYIRIVGDIATGQKHLAINDPRRGISRVDRSSMHVVLTQTDEVKIYKAYRIRTNDDWIEAQLLVQQSFAQWNKFFER